MKCPRCEGTNGAIAVTYVNVSRVVKMYIEDGEGSIYDQEILNNGIAIDATCAYCNYTGTPEEFGLDEPDPREHVRELILTVFVDEEIQKEIDLRGELEEIGLRCTDSGVGLGGYVYTFKTDKCDRDTLNKHVEAARRLKGLLTEKYDEPSPDIEKARWVVNLATVTVTSIN